MADNPQFAHLTFVSPDYVADKAKSESKTVVLDVREPSEFEEGHVKGATNVPSGLFKEPEKLDAVIEQHVKGASEVVVHCMLSKQRGPTAASTLLARIKELGLDAGTEVKVMEGGIVAFMDKYNGDAAAAELPKGTWTNPEQH